MIAIREYHYKFWICFKRFKLWGKIANKWFIELSEMKVISAVFQFS